MCPLKTLDFHGESKERGLSLGTNNFVVVNIREDSCQGLEHTSLVLNGNKCWKVDTALPGNCQDAMNHINKV